MAKNDGWEDLNGGWEDLDSSFIDKATGVGQAAASMISGGLGQIVGGLAAIPVTAVKGTKAGADTVHNITDKLTYEPSRAKGKEYVDTFNKKFGEIMEEHVYPTMENVVAATPFIGDKITPEQREAWARGVSDVGVNFMPLYGVHGASQMKVGKGTKLADLQKQSADKINGKEDPVAPKSEAGWEDIPHQQEMFVQNPYDVGGHVTEAKAGRPTTLDNPQAEMFGRNEPLYNPLEGQGELFPNELHPLNRDGVLNELDRRWDGTEQPVHNIVDESAAPYADPRQMQLQLEQNPTIHVDSMGRAVPESAVNPDQVARQHWEAQQRAVQERVAQEALQRKQGNVPEARTPLDIGFSEPSFDNGVRTVDSTTGRTVQGGDASIPTIDFPLKTEMLHSDPLIQSMRERVARTEADIAEMQAAGKDTTALQGTLDYLKHEFGKYLDESYGVLEKGDAYPALFENGATKLPIEHTTQPTKGGTGSGAQLPIKQTHNAGKGKQFNFKKNQGGAINPDVFFRGFQKVKEILNGKYVLEAKPGRFVLGQKPNTPSEQFRIEVKTKEGKPVGWVNFEDKNGHLEAIDVVVDKAHRRQGIASEMYTFARELGNDISASDKQTALGKQFWNKDHSAPQPVKSATDSIMDRVKQKNEISKNLGKFGKQGGAVNLDLMTFGLAKHAENFRNWFRDSVVKDENNRPLKLYHGTSMDKDFDAFKASKRGTWLTTDPKEASMYAQSNDSQKHVYERGRYVAVNTSGRVMPVYARIEKPYRLTPEEDHLLRTTPHYMSAQARIFEKAKFEGYDGVDWGNGIWVAFEPNQVKSAIGNNGNYAPNQKKMTGAVNPGEIRKGLKELFGKKGIPDKLSETIASASKPDTETKNNPFDKVQALKDSAAGKGLGDMMGWGDMPPETVVEASKGYGDIKPARVQELIENGGLPRAIATRHPVVNYLSDRLAAADKVAQKLIRDNLTDKETGLVGMIKALPVKGDLWQKMLRFEGQDHLTSDILRRDGFSEAEVKVFEKYRELSQQFFSKFNEMRVAMGKKPIEERVAHLAGRFLGDFYVTAERVKLDKDGNPTILPDGSFEKEFIGRIGGSTKWELNKAVKHMQEANPDWKFSDVKYKNNGVGSSAAARYAGFMEVVNQLTHEDPNMGALIKAYEDFLKQDSAKYLNAERHAKGKKAEAGGVIGSEGNKPWLDNEKNAVEGFKAQMAYFEQGYMWMERQKAQADINKVLTAPEVMDMPNVQGWSTRFMDHAFGRNAGDIANGMNAVLNSVGELTGVGHTNLTKANQVIKHRMMQMWMGYLNVRFTLTQLAQPLQSMPPLIARMKSKGLEFSAADAGMKASLSMMKLGYEQVRPGFMKDAKMNAFEKEALQYAHDNLVFDVRMAEHTKDVNQSKIGELHDSVADFNIKYPEMLTRGTAFMFYAHALKDAGIPVKEALPMAEKLTSIAMVDYTQLARPRMYDKMGFVGDLASTLARYKHGQIQNTIMYARDAKDFKQYGPLATHFASMVFWGGLKGLIAFNAADELYKWISKQMGKPGSMADMLISNTPRWVSHGVSGLTGVDMSGSFSNADILPDNPMDFLVPYAGDTGRRVESLIDLAKNPEPFNFKKAAHANAPSSLKGIMEDNWFTDKNGMVLNPRTKEGTYVRSPEERTMRKFGMRSVEEGAKSDHLYAQKYVRDEARKEYRSAAVDKYITALLSNTLTEEKGSKYFNEYVTKGKGDQFARDVLQHDKASKLTAEQRYLLRNAGGNYTGANRLKEYYNLED